MAFKSKKGYTERGDGFYTSDDTDSSDEEKPQKGEKPTESEPKDEPKVSEPAPEPPRSILDYLDVIDATKKVNFLLGIRRPVPSEKKQALEALLHDLENPRVFCFHSGYKTTIEILLKLLREEKRSFEIMAVVVKCLTHLAIRMQNRFAPYVPALVESMNQQFKGRLLHPVLIECINACNGFFEKPIDRHQAWPYPDTKPGARYQSMTSRLSPSPEFYAANVSREEALNRLKKQFLSLCEDMNNKSPPNPAIPKKGGVKSKIYGSPEVYRSIQVKTITSTTIFEEAKNPLEARQSIETLIPEEVDLDEDDSGLDISIRGLVQSMIDVLDE